MEENTKYVTLDDLSTGEEKSSQRKEVSISDIAPYRSSEPKTSLLDEALGDVDSAIQGIKRQSDAFLYFKNEKKMEEELFKEIDDEEDEDSIPVLTDKPTAISDDNEDDDIEDIEDEVNIDTSKPKTKIVVKENPIVSDNVKVNNSINEDDDLLDQEIEDEISENKETEEESSKKEKEDLENFKSSLKQKINPVTKKFNLNSFKISKKPLSLNNALKVEDSRRSFDWFLFESKLPITMTEFNGFDIERLNIRNYEDRYNGYMEIFKLLYDHISKGFKPETVEAWLKRITLYDINDLYFAVYMACYKDTNMIPYKCGKCKHNFTTENIPIESMVKYKDKNIKKIAQDLIRSKYTKEPDFNIQTELVQVNDNYAIEFREPSIWNLYIENSILDPKFTEKYAVVLGKVTFIENIYKIDEENQELRPVYYKEFPGNLKKTVKSRIVTYKKILDKFNSDRLYLIDNIIDEIGKRHDNISYIIPEVTCPKCNNVIEETEMPTDEMVFMRLRLPTLMNL